MSQTFSRSDVASHNQTDDLWIVIDNEVFNISTFQNDHPGGKKSMGLAFFPPCTEDWNWNPRTI
jgi:cytochrome b involved in lipid metabolism